MSLNLSTVEPLAIEIVDALIAAIPGNPALLVPTEQEILNKVVGFAVAYFQTKLSTTVPAAASPGMSAGISAGVSAAVAAAVKK